MIPYYLQMGENSYKDGVDISGEEFYSTVDKYELLKTGIPPVQEVLDTIDSLIEEGYDEFICAHSSSDLTGMVNLYNSVRQMKPEIKIYTVDTRLVGSAAGMFPILAAQLRDQGKTASEIVEILKSLVGKGQVFAIFRELKYLVNGGRMSKAKGLIGSLLKISPILTVKTGEIEIVDKVRGDKKSIQKMVEALKETKGNSKKYFLSLFKGANEEEFQMLKSLLTDEIENAELYYETLLSPVLGVHGGPKVIGASILVLD